MSKFHSDWIERDHFYKRLPDEPDGTPHYAQQDRRVIVCLCGSTRFYEAFQEANYKETMAGRIVLSVGFYPHSSATHGEGVGHDSAEKVNLDELHLDKIDLADEVLVLNLGGYVGTSTRREVLHAIRRGKAIRWLEPERIPEDLKSSLERPHA